VLTSRSYHSSQKSDSLLYYLVLWIMGNGTVAARGVAHLEATARICQFTCFPVCSPNPLVARAGRTRALQHVSIEHKEAGAAIHPATDRSMQLI
jgi:hypothetical protein